MEIKQRVNRKCKAAESQHKAKLWPQPRLSTTQENVVLQSSKIDEEIYSKTIN